MSNRDFPIYTIKNDCQDCYKCVRRCPVKAIKIEDNSAMIIPELCIACGTCYKVCPAKAKQTRNDVLRAKHLIESGKDVYVSLAPSWMVEFDKATAEQMIAGLRRLGFKGVSQTALGAQEVSSNVSKLLSEKKSGLHISTACPSVVEYINKYLPQFSKNLTNFASPLLAHCTMLKKELGSDIEIVFVGPCISKKFEADRNEDLLSLSISFSDIKNWLRDSGINLSEIKTSVFDKFLIANAKEGTAYPIEGGMIETLKPYKDDAYLMQITGVDNIYRELSNLDITQFDKPIFIEALACEGGCVSGPCMSIKKGGLQKRIEILNSCVFDEDIKNKKPAYNIDMTFSGKAVEASNFAEIELKKMLTKIGKYSIDDEINCGGCGYNTCRNFAKALLEGKAEPEMCVSHMKQQAMRKANALLRCIPSPIVIADANLNILEYNDKFIEAFWVEETHADIYDPSNLYGANLKDFIGFTNLFSASLDLEQDIHRQHVKMEDKLYDVVVFNIDSKQIVGGIMEDVTHVELKKEQIADKAKEVISKNLATVQQIACTLGEHMAETEVLLRAIAKDFSNAEPKSNNVKIRTNSNKREV